MSNEMTVKDAVSDENVYFHLRTVDDSVELFDQHGRRFGAVIEHQINTKTNNIITATVTFELSSPRSTIDKRFIACKQMHFVHARDLKSCKDTDENADE